MKKSKNKNVSLIFHYFFSFLNGKFISKNFENFLFQISAFMIQFYFKILKIQNSYQFFFNFQLKHILLALPSWSFQPARRT